MDYFTSTEYAAQHNLTFNPASRHDQLALARFLRKLGYVRHVTKRQGVSVRVWRVPNAYLVETLAAINPESAPASAASVDKACVDEV
jgi:hypothetical protein